jgi:hypothetical protein
VMFEDLVLLTRWMVRYSKQILLLRIDEVVHRQP